MHEENIELLRDEAQRLIKLQLGILQQMLDQQGVVTQSQADQIQTFDRNTTPKFIEMLKGESKKLDRLEMVLAVVGTMKAGKSTTINAIVGTEILPNRSRPMTALPTLIEHTPDQLEPVLEFRNRLPIEQLMGELYQASKRTENRTIIGDMSKNKDMQELFALIESGNKFDQFYHGPESIFWFLKVLNDLVRLSKELGVEFPFSSYDEVHEIPVIKVEFIHLREMNKANGTLTLLDTPGPNESGQPHLRKMLKEQLAKSSAVLAILDFSQLKSDADAQVREELKEIAKVAEGRLYALVNKYDERDRNSDSEKDIKAFVANILMEGNINEDAVFPVSAKIGYLANRAKRELFANKKLPDPIEQPWVADFGKEAFGPRWERQISNVENVREHADFLWEDSQFHSPLENVIRSAHARAAVFAVDSASAKLVDMSEKLGNFLNTRETALSKNSQELRQQISALQTDVDSVGAAEASARDAAEKILGDLENGTKKVFETVKENVSFSINHYFQEGKQEEEAEYNKRLLLLKSQEAKRVGKGIIGNFFEGISPPSKKNRCAQIEADFDSNSRIVKFSDDRKAREMLGKIQDSLEDIVKKNESIMKKAINSALNQFQSIFSNTIILEAKRIIDDIAIRMKKSGFHISLTIPDASLLYLKASGAEMLGDLIDAKTKTVTKRYRKENVWGKICSWFNTDDWGWESYSAQEEYFEIDVDKIKKLVDADIQRIFSGLDKDVSKQIRQPLQDGIRDFFAGFRKTVEQIRGDLLQSIRDHESSKDEKDTLAKRLAALKKGVPDIRSDSTELRKDTTYQLNIGVEATA